MKGKSKSIPDCSQIPPDIQALIEKTNNAFKNPQIQSINNLINNRVIDRQHANLSKKTNYHYTLRQQLSFIRKDSTSFLHKISDQGTSKPIDYDNDFHCDTNMRGHIHELKDQSRALENQISTREFRIKKFFDTGDNSISSIAVQRDRTDIENLEYLKFASVVGETK